MPLTRKPVVGEILVAEVSNSREYVVTGFHPQHPEICLYERTGGSLDPLDHCFIWKFHHGLNTVFSHTGRMKEGMEDAPP